MARFTVTKVRDDYYIVQDLQEGGLGDIGSSGSQEGAKQLAADFEHQYTVSAVGSDPGLVQQVAEDVQALVDNGTAEPSSDAEPDPAVDEDPEPKKKSK